MGYDPDSDYNRQEQEMLDRFHEGMDELDTEGRVERERTAFEAWYCEDMAASGLRAVGSSEIRGLRLGDGYGDRAALNGKWEGWLARSGAK